MLLMQLLIDKDHKGMVNSWLVYSSSSFLEDFSLPKLVYFDAFIAPLYTKVHGSLDSLSDLKEHIALTVETWNYIYGALRQFSASSFFGSNVLVIC